MPLSRMFLDWSRPALPAVADHLIGQYRILDQTDLSDVIVVLPGRRACRRLLELLVQKTNSRLHPPTIITEGQFPELLYEPQRPFANRLVQQLAWGEAVRRLPRPSAERVLRTIPEDDDVDGWMALGELLWKLHRELAAEQLDFGDVLQEGERISGFGERLRWEALHAAQQEYLSILDGLDLWDRQTARLVAIDKKECRSDQDIILIGTVDLNRTTRAMIDQVAEQNVRPVTALVHAPPLLSNRFDEHGCLIPEGWAHADITLDDEQLRVANGPAEQADELIRTLAAFDGRFRADDITIGLADESMVPKLSRRLKQYDVPARWVVGKTLPQTATLRLLESVADYLDEGRSDDFAALVRHPDVGDWLRLQGIEDDWLAELDDYLTGHLQHKLGFWLGRGERFAVIQQVHDQVTALLGELSDERRPLKDWSEAITNLPLAIFENRDFDPDLLTDRAEVDAFEALQEALAEHVDLPELLSPVVSGAQAIRITLGLLEGEAVPPPRDDDAVELLGWLELPLDDAPALVVTSFNERYVPSSVDADLFLPNRLRQELGILDNDRRYARDNYALQTMLASRDELILIAGRRDGRGDPLLPSRLVLATEDGETIARRITEFFEPTWTPPSLPAFSGLDELTDAVAGDDAKRRLLVPRPLPLAQPKWDLSVTAFRDYITCPYRFYLRHILKLSPLDDTAEEMSGRDFGNLLHDVLADFGGSELRNATQPKEIVDYLMAQLDDRAGRTYGRYRLAAVNVQIEQLRTRLQAFANWQAEWAADGWTIEMVEEPTRDRPVPFAVDPERSILLHGRIDRIDRHPDGRWALLDYKTGEQGHSPEKTHCKGGEWLDLQLPLYRHLARVLGVEGDVQLGYVTLPRDTRGATAQIAEWNEDDLRLADETAIEVARKILDEEFWPPVDPAPQTLTDYGIICQDSVFDRGLLI